MSQQPRQFANYVSQRNNFINRFSGLIRNPETANKLVEYTLNFILTIFIVSSIHYIIKGLYFHFCYDHSYIGVFTNLFTIYNPVCYWLNWGQWHLSESIVTITLTLIVTFVKNVFTIDNRNTDNSQNNSND